MSRHLGLLKEAGFVVEDRDAGFTYYGLSPRLREDENRAIWAALEAQFAAAATDPAVRADEARLQEVLRLRKENFDTHASPDTRDARQLVPGRSWAAWSRALGLLLPPAEGRRPRVRRRLPRDRGRALGRHASSRSIGRTSC